ncbi:DUF6650 family protein [uncultured Sphingomonas sp.]|uniref:DUF6650 family protein n=1 Tax=uncultured Sphingomonas sp. TaxID=158754 RepID=UPI0035CC029D
MTGDTARRITGISTPAFGISWAEPGPSQRDRVRDYLLMLEDRRVLYNPMWLEVPSQVNASLHEIRSASTEALRQFDEQDFAIVPIRAIREACRRFHDDAAVDYPHMGWSDGRGDGNAGFFMALGALRATIGQQVASLAAHYDLDVEGDLATVLPQIDEEQE